jgi:plasmid stabilization system protein ParE
MKFTVSVLHRASSDSDRIFEWIAARSPQGAIAWHRKFEEALSRLRNDADLHSVAPESKHFAVEVRQLFFRTRRGEPYRLIYAIVEREVRVLRVRGPGQAPITKADLSE